MFASQYVNRFESEINAKSSCQQQDGATRRAGRQVIHVHRHSRLTDAGSENQLDSIEGTS